MKNTDKSHWVLETLERGKKEEISEWWDDIDEMWGIHWQKAM